MALRAGSTLALDDLACIGAVTKVDPAYLSAKGVYHVIPIAITAKFAGRDSVTFFCFEPRWFESSFDPKGVLIDVEHDVKKYGMYCRNIASEGKPSVLQCLLGEEFDAFAAEFDSMDEVSAEDVGEILRKYLMGREVGYVLAQRKDDEGKLTEQYNLSKFFPATEEGLEAVSKDATNPKRKTPLAITWDE